MKKLLLTLGTIATVVAPIATVVSCGNTAGSNGESKLEQLKSQYRSWIFKYGKDDTAKVTLLALIYSAETENEMTALLNYPGMKDVLTQKSLDDAGGLSKAEVVNFISDEISKSSGQYIVEDNTMPSDGVKLLAIGEAHSIVLDSQLEVDGVFNYRILDPSTGYPKSTASYRIKSIDDPANPKEVTFAVMRLDGSGQKIEDIKYNVIKAPKGIMVDSHSTGTYYYSKDEISKLPIDRIRTTLEEDRNIKVKITLSNEELQSAWDTAISLLNL